MAKLKLDKDEISSQLTYAEEHLASQRQTISDYEEVHIIFYYYQEFWLIICFLVITRESEGNRLFGRKYEETEP